MVDAKVAPEKLQSVIQALLPYLNQSLRSYFSQQPAYVLREDASTGEALAKKYAKGIEVKPGEIVIPFTNYSPGRYGALNFYGNECKGKRLRLSLVPGKNSPDD